MGMGRPEKELQECVQRPNSCTKSTLLAASKASRMKAVISRGIRAGNVVSSHLDESLEVATNACAWKMGS